MPRVATKLVSLKLVLAFAFDVGHNHGQHLFMNVNSRYSVSHELPPAGSGEPCRNLHQPGSRANAAPTGEETMPNYSLNHARSGSNKQTASTYPLLIRPRRSKLLRCYL